MTPSLQTAQLLHASGVACIPCNADKTPRVPSWSPYRTALPTPTELERWFAKDTKLALIAGKVQCLDFDEKYSKGILARFSQRAEETGLDQLLGQLILQQTPSGGYHLVWQCDGTRIGNTKLAEKANHETLIETRGDGGYFLIAPSEGYKLINGDWSSIPSINEEDRDALLNLARTFDERVPSEAHSPPPSGDITPGDDFDFRADMPAMLKKHGWKPASRDGKYWTRPGKAKGISASWDVVPGRFFVFSSSTQFEPQHVYRPWHVYTMLECGGDYARAAGELRRQGFGGVAPSKHVQPLPSDWNPPMEAAPEPTGIDPAGNAPTVETEADRIRRLLRARAYDPTRTPPPLRVIFSLGGVPVCTPGNLTAITAQAKVGKSALTSAITAAAMTDKDCDCLSAVGFNATGKAFLYFDTEQSPDDFWHAVHRAQKRAGLETTPQWLHAYSVADLPAATARKAVAIAMADFAAMHNGIHAAILDGAADLVVDVNDAAECNGFVAELHELAIRYDCAIIGVIHFNPGGEKVRGHLGSQLERKAESNLRLDKDDDVTVIWSSKQRRASINKSDGPRFRWSDEAGMHVSVLEPAVTKTTLKVIELRDMAVEAFNSAQMMSYTDLVAAIVKARSTSEPTAKRHIANMRKSLVIEQNSFGKYVIKSDV